MKIISYKKSLREMQLASELLAYEIWMFYSIVDILSDKRDYSHQAIHNAILESFVIHMRIIIDFFYNDNPKNDDITINDFVDEDWIKSEIPDRLKLARNRSNKEIAHLTFKRTTIEQDKQWKFHEIKNDLQILIDCFIHNMDKKLITERLV